MITTYIAACAAHLEYQHRLINFLGRYASLYPAECVEILALLHHEIEKVSSHYRSKSDLLEGLILPTRCVKEEIPARYRRPIQNN